MIIVVGGGPAGFFGAIRARTLQPDHPVLLLEQQNTLLRKVAASGGGRCNLTHACFEPRELAAFYPRGGRALIGPFTRWSPRDTLDWFAARGVSTRAEPDGRVFPVSDTSSTIVDCLRHAADDVGVEVRTGAAVTTLDYRGPGKSFRVAVANAPDLECDRVLLASGGRTSASGPASGYDLAKALGHTIVPPVPSLFSFRASHPLLTDLPGVAVSDVGLTALGGTLPRKGLKRRGPLLVTHHGISGPAVIQLSALGAREFHAADYHFQVKVNWLPDLTEAAVDETLRGFAANHGRKLVTANSPAPLPRRLWEALTRTVGIQDRTRWSEIGRKPRQALIRALGETVLAITGQAPNKEEFVTCGGVKLAEVDLKTMASKVCPGLFLAGEILDIDGLTGGFNFQACWTTGKLAGDGLSRPEK